MNMNVYVLTVLVLVLCVVGSLWKFVALLPALSSFISSTTYRNFNAVIIILLYAISTLGKGT